MHVSFNIRIQIVKLFLKQAVIIKGYWSQFIESLVQVIWLPRVT